MERYIIPVIKIQEMSIYLTRFVALFSWNSGKCRQLKIQTETLRLPCKHYTCQLLFSKMRKIFVSAEPEFPKIYRRIPKIAEDLPTTSEDNRRCRKIFNDFKTERANDFQRISNQSRALLKSFEDVLTTSPMFLSNYAHYCQLGVKNWSECVRWQF